MTEQDAAKIIMRTLRSKGLHPHIYISIDYVFSDLIRQGMTIDDVEGGLVAGLMNAWLQSVQSYLALTELGFGLTTPANDNGRLRVLH
jgi:hypothetical protein